MSSNGWPGGGTPQPSQWSGQGGCQQPAQGQPSSYQYPASYPAQMQPQQYYPLPPQQPAPKKWLPWLLGSVVAVVVIAVVATTIVVLSGNKNDETASPQSSFSASSAPLPTDSSTEATPTAEPSETPTTQSADPVTPTPTPTTPTPTTQSTAAKREYKDVVMPKKVGEFTLAMNKYGIFSYAKYGRSSQIAGFASGEPSESTGDDNLGKTLTAPEKVAGGKAICGALEDGTFLCYSTSKAFSGSLMVYGYADKGLTYAELKNFMVELFKQLK